jgi:hypothetical protein
MQLKLLLIISIVFVTSVSFAQKRKSKSNSQKPAATQQPTALDPVQQKQYSPKATKKSSKGPTYESEQVYYERMAKLEKTKRKNEELSQKPQYSDPMYFGHKRPPKKRKPGKMKYCKECGLRH